MRPEISEEEAIRRVLHAGTCADYVDVANVVQQQFGLKVGAARVEEVAMQIRNEDHGDAASGSKHEQVLKFVESMGGFDAARAALTELENSLRKPR